MTSFFNKLRIPTLLGLSVIGIGIIAGVYLVIREQTFFSQASINLTPKNILITNTTDTSVTISWQTDAPASSFVNFGKDSISEHTALDDRDSDRPTSRLTHYVTLKNLVPNTSYQFRITSSKIFSEINKFQTAQEDPESNGFNPIIGSVLDGENPLDEGIVYLSISGADTQSALIKRVGNFLIPISLMRTEDLSTIYKPSENDNVKLTVISPKGEATTLIKLSDSQKPLPPLRLGEKIDLTSQISEEELPLEVFDLNSDSLINANDHAIVLLNFGNNPKQKKADLNQDGVVDQKDLDLMADKIRELGGSI
ncbi:fibronectin type III domain-containing protein [Candidatus Daviesbacteria bacterium]|nr:fibronectin type III domain-containing protein [Candidatus Daviesbacteria bacterium]